jgi:para-aminobenzoate synthetase component 1
MLIGSDIQVRLDSADRAAAWNFAAADPPLKCLWCDGKTQVARLTSADGLQRRWEHPLAALEWVERSILDPSNPSGARWIGYLSYDLGRCFEQWPAPAADDLGLPLFVFTYHVPPAHRPAAAAHGAPGACPAGLGVESNFSRREYEAAVKRVIEYIRAGDVFQVNLSQRFTAPLPRPARDIYGRLHAAACARHGAFLDYGDFALLCNSPELFLRVTPDRRVVTRPIKGTRRRGAGMEAELRDSAKDQAELNMIVDLERNDLGRVCRIGSVRVTEARRIETHPTVLHGVATIEGQLKEKVSFVDLLGATFPGGSVTGAPKIRAMQIIDELEPVRRGPYCGAVGYLAADGTMEFNVAIRTMIVAGGRVHIPVGGGIVADSDPAREYEETLVKAQAMFASLGIEMHDGR